MRSRQVSQSMKAAAAFSSPFTLSWSSDLSKKQPNKKKLTLKKANKQTIKKSNKQIKEKTNEQIDEWTKGRIIQDMT